MRILLISLAIVSLTTMSCKKEGCTDPDATNYDEKAKKDDGSCVYVEGCMDPNSSNYNADATKDDGSCTYDVNITIVHRVGTSYLGLHKMDFTNAAGNDYEVNALKYFISDIAFKGNDVVDQSVDMERYVDFETTSTHSIMINEMPTGTYNAIEFTFGLSQEKNVDDYFNTAPEINMEWPDTLGGGYHYMKLEGKYDSSGTTRDFNIYTGIGRIISGNDTSFYQNFVTVSLDLNNFTIDDHAWDIELEMDINQWFSNPNTWDFKDWGESIMVNQTAQAGINENGIDVFSVSSLAEQED